MNALFLAVLQRGIAAGWLVLAVALLRLILRRGPKWVNVLLWGLVAVRLLCPVTLESPVSLIPEAIGGEGMLSAWLDGYVGEIHIHHPDSIYYDAAVDAGREPVSDGEGGYYVVTGRDQLGEPATVEDTVLPVLSLVWIAGAALVGAYTGARYWRLRRSVAAAVRYRDNIFQSEQVDSPFVLGILRPRIYLPFSMDGPEMAYIVAHEQAHIRRRDHWWKLLGFLLLTVYWFHPLMWLAYGLFCRDIEFACDEKVIRGLDREERAQYTQALVTCSLRRPRRTAGPLAFGEVGVKDRVKEVLHYRKPGFWAVLLILALCGVVGLCFLTDPVSEQAVPARLDYETAASRLQAQEEVTVLHYPQSEDEGSSHIQVGTAAGPELGDWLARRDWTPCQAPAERLSSPGSAELVIQEAYRVTLWQRQGWSPWAYGRVQDGEETQYYRIGWGDYEALLPLITGEGETEEDAALLRYSITIYQNPLSSFLVSGTTGFLYRVREDRLDILEEDTLELSRSIPVTAWDWTPLTQEAWEALFSFGDAPDISGIGDARVLRISDTDYCFRMDGSLWLGEYHSEDVGMWFVFAVTPREPEGEPGPADLPSQ